MWKWVRLEIARLTEIYQASPDFPMCDTESNLHWVWRARKTSMYLSTQGKLHYLLYPSLCLPPPPPLHPLPHAHYTLTSYLPPISTVTDDEACEPLRLAVASLSSLRAAPRLLQQLEHNQVGLRAAATHTVAIPAPRGSCLHLCVYSNENLNQTTT